MSVRFAQYTEKIIKALPYWFKIKKKANESIGAKFLNITGLELDDVRYIIEYAYEQTKLESADLDFVDVVYKTIIPMELNSENITAVHSNTESLAKADSLAHFFGIGLQGIDYPELYCSNLYFVDTARNILYVRNRFDVDAVNPDGQIMFDIDGKTYAQSLSLHHVWNFFDEFGLLLSCPRLYGERNREYKNRLLDVFENPAGAHKQGLLNGIARELDLRRKVQWLDGSVDLELDDPMIVLNSIKVGDTLLDETQVYITEHNTVLIPGDPIFKGEAREVSYVVGIEMHQLHNKGDIKLYNELFNVDSTATNLLKYYKDRIHSAAPIMWGDFKWNEAYWDISDKELSGIAFLPALNDANIKGFTSYKRKR
jgi:hypothetical protein